MNASLRGSGRPGPSWSFPSPSWRAAPRPRLPGRLRLDATLVASAASSCSRRGERPQRGERHDDRHRPPDDAHAVLRRSGTLPKGSSACGPPASSLTTCAAIGGLIGGWFALRLGPMFASSWPRERPPSSSTPTSSPAPASARSSPARPRRAAGLGRGVGAGTAPGRGALWAGSVLLHDVQSPPPERVPDEEADRAGGRMNSC